MGHERSLPAPLIRMLEALDRMSSSAPMWRSVLTISAVGIVLTCGATWLAWMAHGDEEAQDFAVVSQLLDERIERDPALASKSIHVLHNWQISVSNQVEVPGSVGGPARHYAGQRLIQSPAEFVWRHAGILTACVSGLLLTMAGLYAYVLIISTRMRAHRIAKETTEAITRSESRSRAVVDTAPDAILTVSDDGQIRWCNQATLSIFGQSLDDLTGKSLGRVIPDLMDMNMPTWFESNGIAGRIIGYETRGCRVEGTQFPISISARRAELDGENINTIIVRDTTDAKWAEQELLLRERALASSAEGIIITDMTLPGQPTIYVNSAFERITGYAMNDIIGQNCKILQRDDQDQPGIRTMRQAIALGQACQVVVRNYRKDGTAFWNELTISPVVSGDNRVTHYVGVASDITARMASEEMLQQRTERLNAVFDLSPDGFVVLDSSGVVSNVNPAFERMTGLATHDLVGQTREQFEQKLLNLCASVEHEETPRTPSANDQLEESQQHASRRELLHLKAPLNRTLIRRIRHDAAQTETVMYFRDLTHELMIDRMKSEFLSMAAHELRTPMASIYGFTELLLNRKFDDSRRTDMLGTIHRQAHILINLINELLDLARIESRRGKDFNRMRLSLQSVIERTVASLFMPGDDRKVKVTLPEQPAQVDADDEKLSQAIVNVLSNAYKYSPAGGDITLDVLARVREGQTEFGVRIIDRGIGMSPEHLQRLFERFFRADTSGNIPGTGLGMTIVKEIVELHGGEVEVDSALGSGTTVILWLPAAEAATSPSDSTSEVMSGV